MDIDKIKTETAERIRALHKELSELVLYAGVGSKGWADLVENIEKKRLSRMEFIGAFLKDLQANEHRRMKEIWEMPNMTPEMWHNYKILFSGPPKLIEQRYMRIASKELVARWAKFKDDLRTRIAQEKAGLVGEPESSTPT